MCFMEWLWSNYRHKCGNTAVHSEIKRVRGSINNLFTSSPSVRADGSVHIKVHTFSRHETVIKEDPGLG